MGEAVLGAGEVVADVLERTREVAGALCLDVGHEHLHDVVRHELARQKLRIVAVVFLAPVRCGLVHLGYGAHYAVHAHLSKLAHKMKPRHAGFVDRFGRVKLKNPSCDLRGRITELL